MWFFEKMLVDYNNSAYWSLHHSTKYGHILGGVRNGQVQNICKKLWF